MKMMNSPVLPNMIVSKIMLYVSHPIADIIKEWFKDDVPWVSKFTQLGYWGFIPLIKRGSNGRKIEIDFEKYWEEYIDDE